MKKKNDSVVSIENFTMKFGDTTVVDNLSFDVRRGETFGLLGSNGSGKQLQYAHYLGFIVLQLVN